MNQETPTHTPLRAYQIERWLVSDRFARATVMPRFAPPGWWECDVAELTTAGYLVEWEIKTSRSDFSADARKVEVVSYSRRRAGVVPRTKHERLAARDTTGPSRFWFVVPAGMLTDGQVPEWAGWAEANARSDGRVAGLTVMREAPRLHAQKASPAVGEAMRVAAYYRFHRAPPPEPGPPPEWYL